MNLAHGGPWRGTRVSTRRLGSPYRFSSSVGYCGQTAKCRSHQRRMTKLDERLPSLQFSDTAQLVVSPLERRNGPARRHSEPTGQIAAREMGSADSPKTENYFGFQSE
jgi:hypothetical protein